MMDYLGTLSGILVPAFIAGLIVLSTHVPLGQEVLRRGIVFFDLAVAQVSALGLLLAEALGVHALLGGDSPWLTQLVAIAAAVVGASALYLCRSAPSKIQEALIGVVFMLASTASLMLLAKDPHGGERLQAILTGQILWVNADLLIFSGGLSLLLAATWFGVPSLRQGFAFYPLFAVAVTLSTQLVGVYLVFASLILPALATTRSRHRWLSGYGVGILGYALGLLVSALWDVPSGALITWMMAMVAMVYYLGSSRELIRPHDRPPYDPPQR